MRLGVPGLDCLFRQDGIGDDINLSLIAISKLTDAPLGIQDHCLTFKWHLDGIAAVIGLFGIPN